MPPTLSPEGVRDALRAIGRPALAELLSRHAQTPLADYSAWLHRPRPTRPLEPALARAFRAELGRSSLDPAMIAQAMETLEQARVIQTGTHVTASEGPIFFAMHALATLALPRETPYVVGACSGIPFSNNARPGCLNFSRRYPLSAFLHGRSRAYRQRLPAFEKSDSDERRLSLLPWSAREAPVWRAPIPREMGALLPWLRSPLRDLLSPAVPGASFARWALSTCEAVESKLLDRRLIFLDLNEVVAAYLGEVLGDAGHPLTRALFTPALRDRMFAGLPEMALFTTAEGSKEHPLFVPLRLQGEVLCGPRTQIPWQPSAIVEGIQSGALCPGVFLTFATMAFLGDFRCLGGVDQLEYLPLFREACLRGELLSPAEAEGCSLDGLTSGRCVDAAGEAVYPLDMLLGTRWRIPEEGTLLGYLAPQLPRLLLRPFKWGLGT
ncbi:MAG: hypothetical protein ABI193_04690 [Minicystis sp.]